MQVTVEQPVASVEVRLDQRTLGELRGPPWSLECDFGDELRPAELVAVAFDADGRELGRDRQWLNLPRPAARATILPGRDDNGRVVMARVIWSCPEFGDPRQVRATLDGAPIPNPDPRRIDLGTADPRQMHVLHVTLEFSDSLEIHRELTFGSGHAGAVSAELTAVPIVLEDGDEMPRAATMEGWLEVGAEPARVSAIEVGPARLVVVRDLDADATVRALHRRWKKSWGTRHRLGGYHRTDLPLCFARVMTPIPRVVEDRERPTLVFPTSGASVTHPMSLFRAVEEPLESGPRAGRRLASAVAVAAMEVARENRRRVVLLMLGKDSPDPGDYAAGVVRRYLERLRVPLVVWQLGKAAAESESRWGPVESITTFEGFLAAAERAFALLDAQRIVWVSGTHLPQSITLGPGARGLRLAGVGTGRHGETPAEAEGSQSDAG